MGVIKKSLDCRNRAEASYICHKVLEERFPDIPQKEIGVLYDYNVPCADIITTYDYHVDDGIICETRAEIIVGEMFFLCTKEEQEAFLAHELGHYRRKKTHIGRHHSYMERKSGWQAQLEGLEKRRHSKKRLLTWYILSESYADNEAINCGLGFPLLSGLKKLYEHYITLDIEERNTRISNLEKILGEK